MQGGAIRRARTDLLEIGYEDHGKPESPMAILLHGFPDEARAWDQVAPRLVGAGYRVIAGALVQRGSSSRYGPARPSRLRSVRP